MIMSFFEDDGSATAHSIQPPPNPAMHSFYPPISNTHGLASYHDERFLHARPQGSTSSQFIVPQASAMANTSNAMLDYPYNYIRRPTQGELSQPEIVHPSGFFFTTWHSRNEPDSSEETGEHRMQSPSPQPSHHVSSAWHSLPSLSHTTSNSVGVYSTTSPEPATSASSPPSLSHQYRRLPQKEDDMVALRPHFQPRGTAWECLAKHCGHFFPKQSDAHAHFLKEHLGKSKLFECIDWLAGLPMLKGSTYKSSNNSAAQFSSEATARRHQENQVKRYSCNVPGCSKKFARADYRNFHQRICSMSRIGA